MTINLATANEHKADELRPLLSGHRLLTARELGFDFDVPEDGDTFLANAVDKALALYRQAGGPALADDSGLCVDALGGRPGVLSARYGSPDGRTPLPSPERNALLLAEMDGERNRTCRFVCCLALVLSPDRVVTAQETCEGILLDEPRGTGGFGYDPIVYLPGYGKTVAELDAATKNLVSHRGRALRRLRAVLADLESWS
ncbi:MAG: non-canonical purine NTP pyrophosphatase [Spirochaetia bacterium]|nr:non-canonical purine NTP pyrophosphatase [Spirochaetia bacterium]